ncbi:hypothetical protein ANN_06557 [Periplaneta americana]|uniref:Reverse transcriptase domain-containing protein n=1 Tax=Periplaneta americana TaxID=6978 RepID=A0ABQ8TE07_PERAM|nr:hypothetical protein ANN_06557 [Periplaneta americana]
MTRFSKAKKERENLAIQPKTENSSTFINASEYQQLDVAELKMALDMVIVAYSLLNSGVLPEAYSAILPSAVTLAQPTYQGIQGCFRSLITNLNDVMCIRSHMTTELWRKRNTTETPQQERHNSRRTIKIQKEDQSSTTGPRRRHGKPQETNRTRTTKEKKKKKNKRRKKIGQQTETDNARNEQTEFTRTRRLNQTFLQQRTATLEIATDQIKREEIEDALETVVEYIRGARIKQRKRIAKPWFDRECYERRKEALNQLHTAKQSRTKEALRLYSEKRKDYKRIIKEKKNNYIEEQAKKQAEEAQKNPIAAQKQISKVSAAGIQIATWKKHFTSLLNKNQAEEAYSNNQTEEVTPIHPIRDTEVKEAIKRAKNKKAPGPDGIFNENLKETADKLVGIWTKIFRRCSTLPQNIITQGLDVTIILYADDMVFGSSKREDLQIAVDRLEDWATDNDFKINKNKTVMMIFRKGERMAAEDKITLEGEELQRVNHFREKIIAYELAKETFFIEDIKDKMLLPSTPQATKHIRQREEKRAEIYEEFYTSDAMSDRNCKPKVLKTAEIENKLIGELKAQMEAFMGDIKSGIENMLREEIKTNLRRELQQHLQRPSVIKQKAPNPPTKQGNEGASEDTFQNETTEPVDEKKEERIEVEDEHSSSEIQANEESPEEERGTSIEVAKRKKPRENTRITGTRDPENIPIRAADKTAWLYVGRLHQSVEKEGLIKYLEENGISGAIECEELSVKGINKAFRVGIPFELKDLTEQPEFWPRGVVTATWNTEGLINALDMIPEDNLAMFDVIVLTETFLRKEWNAKGFYTINALATQGQRGRPVSGITCLIKPELAPFKIERKSPEMLIIRTRLCTIIGVYLHPNYKEEEIIDIISGGLAQSQQQELVIIAGDMNCRIDVRDHKAETVLQFLEEEGLTLINKASEKTYKGDTRSAQNSSKKTHACRNDIYTSKGKPNCPRNPKISRKLDTQMIEQSHTQIKEAEQEIQTGHIDRAVNKLEHIITNATRITKPIERKAKPWFNRNCYQARQLALHSALTSRSEETLKEYANERRKYKTLIRESKREHYEEKAREIIEESENDPFRVLKQRKPTFPRDIPMDTWVQHFTEILQSKDTRPLKETAKKEEDAFLETFTQDEVLRLVMGSKDKKASGPDNIFNEHLKSAAPMLIKAWKNLFNECLLRGSIPERWRTSRIKTLYKGKCNASDPHAYRGIALECTLLKILTKVVAERITALVDHHIPAEQFGFRKNRSTIQAVECLQENIKESLHHPKGKLYTVFVDYTKAFDTINRTKLIAKLENLIGRRNPIARLIRDILMENSIRIEDTITVSTPIDQTTGVLQGDPLSPLLFNIATHDVVEATKAEELTTYLYADDMVMASTSRNTLQGALDRLVEWARGNDLTLNRTKTVAMTFKRDGK